MFKDDDTCLKKVGPKEPIFVLRAQDALAPSIVRDWAIKLKAEAELAGAYTEDRREKHDHAFRLAAAMEAWQAKNRGSVKLPD